MFSLLITLVMLICIVLMAVILMQSSKGGGLAGSFGGGNVGTMFGVRRTADFLSRATTILAIAFIGLCLLINTFFLPGKANVESIIQRRGASGQGPITRPVPPVSQPATSPNQQAPAQQKPAGK